MIEKSGTGASASQSLLTSSLPAGFYTLGVRFEASGMPANAGLSVQVTSPHPVPLSAAVAWNQPNASGTLGPVYLQPGDVLNYQVNPFGNYGSNPPASWVARFFLYKGEDVAS